MRGWVGFCVVACVLAFSSHSAASAGQWRGGISAGVAAPPSAALSPGPEFGASLTLGMHESLDLTLRTTLVSYEEGSEQRTALSILPGVLYKLDVLRWVPYAGAGVGLAQGLGAPNRSELVVDALLGLDYLVSRRWSAGLEYRASFIPGAPEVPLSHLVMRLGLHWGY